MSDKKIDKLLLELRQEVIVLKNEVSMLKNILQNKEKLKSKSRN